jgi:uncharacterized membrane protein YgcG
MVLDPLHEVTTLMLKSRWLLALPLALAFTIGSAHASSIRDGAGLFDPDAVREAEAKLNQIERDHHITTTIETVESLDGQPLDSVAQEHARRSGSEGIFIFIPKQEHKIEVLASRAFTKALPRERRLAIRDAFVEQFKSGDFNAGLNAGVETVAREVAAAQGELGDQLRRAEGPVPPVARPQAGKGFGLGSLLGIGLLILAVLVGVRLLGSLFGAGRQYQQGPGPGMMGRPGYGPGPGYGGGGYGGGRGGGFMSSLFGGLGGAMAGNWLYDQFSGRHHGGNYADNTATTPGNESIPTSDPGNDWVGGGSEAGDWGGGGGDGGGDWGGGGGGGDWGGGDDGGSW